MLPDLITPDYATSQLLSAGIALSADELACLPSWVTSASGAIRKLAGGRDFSRQTYLEDHAAEADGSVFLRQLPVNKVLSVAGLRDAALVVTNADSGTNARASAGFDSTGDEDSGITFTGLGLARLANGQTIPASIPFAAYPTIAAVAAQVGTLGGGWLATYPADLGGWPSAELAGGDVATMCLNAPASFAAFSVPVDAAVHRKMGVLKIRAAGFRGAGQAGFWDGEGSRGLSRVRVSYDAGYDLVPAAIQLAAANLVGWYRNNLARDLALSSEAQGAVSYAIDAAARGLLPGEITSAVRPYLIARV